MEKQTIMKQIELETEQKILNAYKTGQIKIPFISKDGENITKTEAKKQMGILQSIMAEGVAKFQENTNTQMSYSEMRGMFG
jgi:vacuolar-type H+-ATPase subunit E/Vma4